jgi:hypothetical protein
VSQHYTPEFLAAWAPVEKLIQESGGEITDAAKVLFRDQMVALGHEQRVANMYRVKDKLTMQAVFLQMNGPQKKFMATRKGRDQALKIRQVGMTTLSCVRALDYALWTPNLPCGIMAHQQNVVAKIFDNLPKFTYSWFKRDWGHLYAPVEKSDSAHTLSFRHDGLPEEFRRELNSSMSVMYDYRGQTVWFLHVSEAARIEPERLLGSLQGVPATGEVILESTPNGRGGEFYRQWQNWRTMGSLAPYKGHFIPWYEFYPEDPDKWLLPVGAVLTPYEREMKKTFGLTDAHIAWRRWCVEANCQGDPEKFENEYPSNDIDCWFTGENLVFGTTILKLQDRNVREPARTGFLLSDGAAIKFVDDGKGYFSLWKEPEPGCEYVAGADPSGGVGRDRAAAVVMKRGTGEMVARLWGQLEPSEFSNELWKLLTFYNKAFVNPEANNHGHVVIHSLKTKGYRNLYKRKVLDGVTNKLSTQYGFLTTNDSKLMLTERFKDACKHGRFVVRDGELLNEMSTFVQVASKQGKSVRREASPGCHDDLLMAACLAWEMEHQRGVYAPDAEEDAASAPDTDEQFDQDTGMAGVA